MTGHRYTPYYCEENVWHLLREHPAAFEDPWTVFIANEAGSVAFWSQRASSHAEGLTVWDYHVVALGHLASGWHVIDLDCTAGGLLPVEQWVRASFPFVGVIPPELEPAFRIVAAETWLEHFRSDRSHMRDEGGGWLATPPEWDTISDSSNLSDYVDLASSAPGEILDLGGLLDRFGDRE